MRMIAVAAGMMVLAPIASVHAETVAVMDRGAVDLAAFTCHTNPSPSFLKRTCYDAHEGYLLIQLNQAWYHFCEVDRATYDALDADPHKGTYFANHLKGTGHDGPFDCRTHRVPAKP